ncbi:hypothetical protein [Caudoviricetes sp.]|nr:hypothetical protein [Caudoviricetes sp.]
MRQCAYSRHIPAHFRNTHPLINQPLSFLYAQFRHI